MKKLASLVAIACAVSLSGCALFAPATPEVTSCRVHAIEKIVGKEASVIVDQVVAGKLDLVSLLTQLGATYNDIFAAVMAFNSCEPTNPTNPTLPKPPVELSK